MIRPKIDLEINKAKFCSRLIDRYTSKIPVPIPNIKEITITLSR